LGNNEEFGQNFKRLEEFLNRFNKNVNHREHREHREEKRYSFLFFLCVLCGEMLCFFGMWAKPTLEIISTAGSFFLKEKLYIDM